MKYDGSKSHTVTGGSSDIGVEAAIILEKQGA
jgi:short-subunit dehydrogenase